MTQSVSALEEGSRRTILPHQRPVYDGLVDVAKACFGTVRSSIPLPIRTNSLLIGPSGSGKTYLARAVAEHFQVPLLSLSVADWILIGCSERGGINTWPSIVRFLQANRRKEGLVIFIDELQHACGTSSWERFLRVELFSLLDFRIPQGLSAKIDDEQGERTFSRGEIEDLQKVLENRTLIIGAGAFQELWDNQDRSHIGFGNSAAAPNLPTLKTLRETLPTELINRFRSKLLILPPLALNDYETMLKTAASNVPGYLRETFLRLGRARLPEVCRLRQGTRFLEELMLDTLLTERARLRHSSVFAPQMELDLNRGQNPETGV